MFKSFSIIYILNSLTQEVDLGIMAVPAIVLISATLVFFGLGLRKSWLSFTGVFLIFSFYLMQEIADFGLLDFGSFS